MVLRTLKTCDLTEKMVASELLMFPTKRPKGTYPKHELSIIKFMNQLNVVFTPTYPKYYPNISKKKGKEREPDMSYMNLMGDGNRTLTLREKWQSAIGSLFSELQDSLG